MVKVEILTHYGLPESYISLLKKRGIEKLNPVQKHALDKGLLSDRNILVVAPTASGKTLIGEIALVKTALNNNIGLYLVPLRALASEKYREFQKLAELGIRIGISTGDYESPAEHLGRNNIIIATYERFDSLLRLKPTWLKHVKCVVIDELHNVNDPERGPIIEMIVSRLLRDNIRVIGLSATIGNPHILAKWLKAELVNTPWRPVKLVEGYYDKRLRAIILFDDQGEKIEKINHNYGNTIINIAVQSIMKDIQVLVFIHNRRRAEEYAERIIEYLKLYKYLVDAGKVAELLEELKESPSKIEREKLGRLIKVGVAYHHAGLSSVARRVVEKGFRERVLRIVFATPTLAAGVNLPARRVLVSIKRYDPVYSSTRNIPVFEYKQMAGRAGRPQYDPYGEAIIYDAKNLREALSYIKGSLEPITSKLGNERSLRIHVLSLIASNEANELDGIIEVFKNTLYHVVSGDIIFIRKNIEKILKQLINWKMVIIHGRKYLATKLGRITSITYLDPLTTHRYLTEIPEKPGVLYYLHKITYTPDYMRSRPYISEKIINRYEDEALINAEEGIIPEPPTDPYEYNLWIESYVQARMLHDWINEVNEDTIIQRYGVGPGDIYSARDTASWIAGALSRVENAIGNSERADDLERLSIRLEHGVREDALQLIKLEGIGRVRARILLNKGIRSLEDLAKTPDHVLENLPGFGPKLVKNIKEQLKDLLKN